MAGDLVSGWKLDPEDRDRLLQRFAPTFPDIVASHVTLRFGTDETTPLPPDVTAAIVGEVDDGAGVQALVVSIDGSTDRPDGSTYHITWSLDRAAGRTPIESNDVIKRLGWRALAEPVPITLYPARI